MKNQIQFLRKNSKYIFLIDGLGAIFSEVLLSLVLPLFVELLGMPIRTLYILALVPLVFAVYSLLCYFLNPSQWKLFLRVIAVANFLYCVLTMVYLVINLEQTTFICEVYFVLEMIVVVSLASWEWKLTKK
ncbi:hypothetical protein ND861_09220 [Leptospira sp. 2 VSF19]|uniref:Uncharacterized protein n=1 Tax=Leptospira soteropolitanensis TaxID=2950025 RepID=A0AAW5VNW2_9LEPT|nr:hypothetical protein [Leptospira soteropolitanensis]MCW7492616.1 hypothetical protein [Leptospira soteropolitanensis]MCW7500299.1 hypothetical protein [Leptospira soteropolitanensis]MCW7522666.1 hypothetical protein [Leptospira soteropolitanensis]MCW7526522.1 hypothetical protein [Leptospira soteropolitanensis]MCW7530269.1 hypothetical protein [Leptospira soteropolitanensis]